MNEDDFVEYKFDGKYTETTRDRVFNFLNPIARKYNLMCYVNGKYIKIPHRPSQITESLNTLKDELIGLKPVQCIWSSGKNEDVSMNSIQIDPYGMLGDFRVNLMMQSTKNLKLFREFPMKEAHHGVSWSEWYDKRDEQKVKGNHAIYIGGEAHKVDMEMLDAVISFTTKKVLRKTGVI